MKHYIFTALILLLGLATGQAQTIEGDWYGILEIGKSQLSIVFHVQKDEAGWVTTMDSPDQGAKGLETDETIVEDNDFIVKMARLGMSYKGTWDEESDMIKGKFSQAGMTLPLDLSRKPVAKKITPRKQEPLTFPYQVEEVKFKNTKAEGVELAGTLTLPKSGNVQYVVILISGSGAQDRNADLGPLNHRPFLVWSDYLTRNGIGVLRYDDRGTAQSTGDFQTATSADFATDVEAAIAYLRSRKDLKGVKIGLMGHSEGGMIAPMVAAKDKALDFIVLLAAPAVPIQELMSKQVYDISRAANIDENILVYQQESNQRLYEYIIENPELQGEEFMEGLSAIIEENVENYPPLTQGVSKDKFIQMQRQQYASPWFRYFIAHDPAPYLKETNCRIFALNGELDLQVNAENNLGAIEKILEDSGNEHFDIQYYENLNHLFQKADTGTVAEYATIEETVNEQVLKDVLSWILKKER